MLGLPSSVIYGVFRVTSGRTNFGQVCLLLGILLCVGCKKSQEAATITPTSLSPGQIQQPGSIQAKIEACSLVTKEEVAAIQKATITNAKSSAGPSGNLVMSQCYYSAKEPNMSVSLAILQPSSRSTAGSEARDYWENTMRGSPEESAGNTRDDEGSRRREKAQEEQKKNPAKKIEGVGEEAFWSGNRVGGALYVLHKNVIVRISVGGPDDQETKITKSKALAAKAIARL